jgi:hypothetical protein
MKENSVITVIQNMPTTIGDFSLEDARGIIAKFEDATVPFVPVAAAQVDGDNETKWNAPWFDYPDDCVFFPTEYDYAGEVVFFKPIQTWFDEMYGILLVAKVESVFPPREASWSFVRDFDREHKHE